jgi:hypothetical protein
MMVLKLVVSVSVRFSAGPRFSHNILLDSGSAEFLILEPDHDRLWRCISMLLFWWIEGWLLIAN